MLEEPQSSWLAFSSEVCLLWWFLIVVVVVVTIAITENRFLGLAL